MATPYEILLSQGFVSFPESDSNIINAEKAFFGSRVIQWIQKKAPEADFNLQAYLIALTYYKLDLADLKFEENELLYRYRGISFEGAGNEFNKDNPKVTAKFLRPDETLNSDGTVRGSSHVQEPPQGDE
tara:strand:+ start:1562 stop:1948 length:387 start_codon:yes stop_codon:yes gene_type:complete